MVIGVFIIAAIAIYFFAADRLAREAANDRLYDELTADFRQTCITDPTLSQKYATIDECVKALTGRK